VRRTNRLTSPLKTYCPHALPWCEDKATLLFCDVLAQWPPLKATQLARRVDVKDHRKIDRKNTSMGTVWLVVFMSLTRFISLYLFLQ
jgi:hypothetical protein